MVRVSQHSRLQALYFQAPTLLRHPATHHGDQHWCPLPRHAPHPATTHEVQLKGASPPQGGWEGGQQGAAG